MNETRKGSDAAERIAEKLLGENESVCMLKWGAEQVRAELAEHSARVERLVRAAQTAEHELRWLSLAAFPQRSEDESVKLSPAIQALRAALDGMGEP